MKKSAEEFNATPTKKWAVTDSDGTMTPFVPLQMMQEAKPSKEYLENLRQASFANPEMGFMILTGRKNGEANNFYGEALKPDEDGRRPKIVIASENGAFMQFKPIESDELMIPATTDGMNEFAKPMSEELKERVRSIMSNAAGSHYTEDSNDTSESKWIRAEVKTYGFTAHYREPSNPEEKAEFNQVKEQIKSDFEALGRETDLEVHLGATSSFTVEQVSKGTTIAKLADNDPQIQALFQSQGITTAKPEKMSYSGDDVGDRAAQTELNNRFKEGTLEGYTSRPNNFTPFDPAGRVPNGPKETEVQDSLYIIGNSEMLPQEIHRSYFIDPQVLDTLDGLRQDLSSKGLLPSQNGDQTPPIVLLTSGDILIQEPERLPQEALNSLKEWDRGKVVLIVDQEGPESVKLKQMPQANENIVAVTSKGAVYTQGAYLDLQGDLTAAKNNNQITSASPERSAEVQALRAIQSVLITNGVLQNIEAKPAAQQEVQEDSKPAAQQQVQPAAQVVQQEVQPAAQVAQVALVSSIGQLAAMPVVEGGPSSRTRRSTSQERTQAAASAVEGGPSSRTRRASAQPRKPATKRHKGARL
ncbi:hypothetical protein [Ascidiimonas sp. W6]|uniref:hypothetical protein n=1 Tax=Ascidiimonas meishanensis TaxID=3128903 RepID=UPI0030EF1B72